MGMPSGGRCPHMVSIPAPCPSCPSRSQGLCQDPPHLSTEGGRHCLHCPCVKARARPADSSASLISLLEVLHAAMLSAVSRGLYTGLRGDLAAPSRHQQRVLRASLETVLVWPRAWDV